MRFIFLGLILYSSVTKAMDLVPFLNSISLALTVSEFEYKSTNDDLEIETSFSLSNKNQESFLYLLKASLYYERSIDQDENAIDSEQKTAISQRYELKNLIYQIHYTNFFEMKREKKDGRYTTKYDFDIGPFGFKKNFIKTDLITELSLEYMPLYNYREYYASGTNNEEGRYSEESILHRLNCIISFSFFKDVLSLSNTISIQRIEAIDNRSTNIFSNEFDNKTELTLQATNSLDFGYSVDVNTDQIRARQGLPKTERVHKINLTYRWN